MSKELGHDHSAEPRAPCPDLLSFCLHYLQPGTGVQWRSLSIREMISSSAWQKVLGEAGQRGVPTGALEDEQSLGRSGPVLKTRAL